ncbi:alpha/beta fold hydrolase [Aquimarina agarivorans]|uniref:alpha/beta fold hydrolase n=1 Tax=Aquimarina agarivorans TaxID=980584 RepID=UPI00068025FD|nr:alpha/beta fold hydrolase [Aquimarina agarivorans]
MKSMFISLLCLIGIINCPAQDIPFTGKTIQFPSEDTIPVTADLYMTSKPSAPFILLCHQALFSRGSYREIATQLNELGYNCLAIDQRSGLASNNITNETHKAAKKENKPTKYINALPDIIAAYNYIKNDLKASKIIIWGSSYSASLSLYLASKKSNELAGVLAFSPGEYFKIEDKTIAEYASKITCPAFLTSSKTEAKKLQPIYNAIPSKHKVNFTPHTKGFHGSKALWSTKSGNEAYWTSVKNFLSSL